MVVVVRREEDEAAGSAEERCRGLPLVLIFMIVFDLSMQVIKFGSVTGWVTW